MDVAYLPKNVEPRIDEIEITPPITSFPAPVLNLAAVPRSPSQTPHAAAAGAPIGADAPAVLSASDNITTTPAMQFAKGYLGARWLASDPNGDTLVYTRGDPRRRARPSGSRSRTS